MSRLCGFLLSPRWLFEKIHCMGNLFLPPQNTPEHDSFVHFIRSVSCVVAHSDAKTLEHYVSNISNIISRVQ